LNISNLKVKLGTRLFGLGWGIFNLAPAVAEPIAVKPSDSKHPVSTRVISKQAQDLLPNLERPNNNASAAEWLVKLNLEKFCQNYPYNSRCSGEPGTVRSPIPVPVPPPEPLNDGQETNIKTENISREKTGWAIVPEASTIGLGGQVVKRLSTNVNARVGVNAFKYGIDVQETDFDYKGDLNLFNVSTILDLYPIKKSGLRISGGLVFNDNNIQGTADVSQQVTEELGEVEINGRTVNAEDLNLDGLITFDNDIDLSKSVAPYLGIGGGNAVGEGKGLGFWWNLGVVFSGAPKVEINSSISDTVPAEIRQEVETAANEELEQEEQDLEDELDFLKVLPVVSLGLSYQL
jgi:hypothetical protein